MAYERIKEFVQNKFLGDKFGHSKDGVCYYVSEYTEQQIWKRPEVGSYETALQAARNAVPQKMIVAAKAKNLNQRRVPQEFYPEITTSLAINSVYRVGLWAGDQYVGPATQQENNHEAILVTGTGGKIIFMEPNFGFYESDRDAMNTTNKDAFEWAVDDLYSDTNWCALNFTYKRVRHL